MKRLFSVLLIFNACCFLSSGQTPLSDTNLQILYDLGGDRHYFTTTLEMFHPDTWGNTFFFVDLDYNFRDGTDRNVGPSGAYMEIERCLNFWRDSALKNLSIQVEYDGGLGAMFGGYTVHHAFLAGLNYGFHSADFSKTLNFGILYKKYVGLDQLVPLQFSTVWGVQNLFGVTGLRFSGFADVWCEGNKAVFISEPQLWYNIGQFFKCPNLNLGGEVELSGNFAGYSGFACRPCLGLKWVF